ncbi:MAG: Holliday junction resolvase RuvX [Planctomycetes bacterium]|nr:Holliday junction resolvase RuvX [Planctomycetota bacterium]
MRYLAIDHGQKRTGLAVSDASETLVSPHSVIETQSSIELLKRVLVVIDEEGISAVVIGMPFNMDGSEGPRAVQVREFAKKLADRVDIPIIFQDERLSSFEAEGLITSLELTRKKKKKRLDALAAAEILKAFFAEK